VVLRLSIGLSLFSFGLLWACLCCDPSWSFFFYFEACPHTMYGYWCFIYKAGESMFRGGGPTTWHKPVISNNSKDSSKKISGKPLQ
jgi:hypothetical protein